MRRELFNEVPCPRRARAKVLRHDHAGMTFDVARPCITQSCISQLYIRRSDTPCTVRPDGTRKHRARTRNIGAMRIRPVGFAEH